jgi:hypothetical protein
MIASNPHSGLPLLLKKRFLQYSIASPYVQKNTEDVPNMTRHIAQSMSVC